MGTQAGGGTPGAIGEVGATGAVGDVAEPVVESPPGAPSWRGWRLWLALVFLVLFVLVALLTLTGATQSLDTALIHRLRPMDRWGEPQERWIPWMSRFSPNHVYGLLAVTSLVMAAWRRSWWPLVFGVVLAGVSIGTTVAVKIALGRGDPHGYVTTTGGSYPSGHTVAVVAALGGCLLVVFPRVRWWLWTPLVIATGLMSAALLVSAVHWPTDVLGGVLLGLALLSAASGSPLRRRACQAPPPPWLPRRLRRQRS